MTNIPQPDPDRPYPAFGDDPARWGLLPEPPMTAAELDAAADLKCWGPEGPSASYAEWLADGQRDPATPERETGSKPIPYTLTAKAEALLDAEHARTLPEPEAGP
jgi:hypothetical protein